MKKLSTTFLLLICMVAVTQTGFGQDAASVINSVATTVGMARVKTLHYTGSGSSYVVKEGPVPTGGWPHSVMKSYVRDMNLEATTSKTQVVRIEGTPPAEKTITEDVNPNSPWSSQYEFWIMPFGFLKGAMANNATLQMKTVLGTTYKAITFTLPGGHQVVGYINDKNVIERVETSIDGTTVEALYRDYTDFNGVKFPALVTEKRGGELSLILVVKDVKG